MKKLIISSIVLITLATATSFALTSPTELGAESDLPVKVQHQQEQLDNHEARLTNLEADVSDLQDRTNTPPSVQRVEVPIVNNTSLAEPTPEPKPVVVVSSNFIVNLGNGGNCEVVYSDGSKSQKPSNGTTTEHQDGSQGYDDNCDEYVGQIRE